VAFKLSKQELELRDQHVEKLERAWSNIEQAISSYNQVTNEELREPVEKAVADYNEVLGGAKEFAEKIANRMDGEFDEKSEKWRDSERGQAAAELRDTWQEMEMEKLELEWPDDLAVNDPDHAPELAELPTEAE
jgi:hypothetical protein